MVYKCPQETKRAVVVDFGGPRLMRARTIWTRACFYLQRISGPLGSRGGSADFGTILARWRNGVSGDVGQPGHGGDGMLTESSEERVVYGRGGAGVRLVTLPSLFLFLALFSTTSEVPRFPLSVLRLTWMS